MQWQSIGVRLGWAALLAALSLSGCRPTPIVQPIPTIGTEPAGSLAVEPSPTAGPAAVPSPTPERATQADTPAIAAAAPANPAAAPANPAAAPAMPTALPTSSPPPPPTAAATASPTHTPTPAPTFTPPPPPPAHPSEHFVFARPVPLDSTPWTNKVYPYGGTRGGALQPHHGVEFDVGQGTPVLAAGAGTVIVAGDDLTTAYGPTTDFYGNLVVLEHGPVGGSPVYTLYGHLSQVDVAPGEPVTEGQPIGLSGESGVAYGPHLHFEVRSGNNLYSATRNPLLWLAPLPGTGVVAGQVTWPGGEPATDVPIILRRVDGQAPYTATTSYAAADLNPDDSFAENFVLDDVEPGFYEIQAGDDGPTAELWVFPGRLTFVDLILEP